MPAVVTFVLTVGTASQARADEGEDHAKRAGVAYSLQDWPTAVAEYQAAFRVEQKPEYLWGLAQAQRLGGDCATAKGTYKAYSRLSVTPQQTATAEALVTKCEAEIAKHEAEAKAASAPPPQTVHEPSAPPPEAKPPESKPPPPARSVFTAPVIVAGGVAIVGAVVGSVFGAMALGAHDTFRSTPTSSNADTTRTNALVADIGFGVAVAGAITTAVLIVTRGPSKASTAASGEPVVVPMLDAHGGGLAKTFRF